MIIRSIRTIAAVAAIAVLGVVSAVSTSAPALAGSDKVVSQGTFEGRSKHITTGGAQVVKSGDGYVLVLAEDFSLDGAPAPTIGFGNGGEFDKSTEFTKLNNITGKQSYPLPSSVDPSKYDEVYIWCADFSVPLGVAKLN